MSSSSSASSSWSDLPIDILINIREKLELHHRSNLVSFRSVCSHWHSTVPIPEKLQNYEISFCRFSDVICFTKVNNNIDNDDNNISNTHYISLPFFTSSRLYFFCSSNGWLVFRTRNNQNFHLFNPVSNHKIICPRLSYSILKPTFRNISHILLLKLVVSSSLTVGIVVACIIGIFHRDRNITEKRFVACRHGVGQKWRLLMKKSDDIIDITLIGNDHIYALDKYLNLYMLDERSPSMILVRFRLWVPKQILQAAGVNDPIDKQLYGCGSCMKASGKSDLKIYLCSSRSFLGPNWISLKLNVAELCSYSADADADVVDVACEAEWVGFYNCLDLSRKYFSPLLRPSIKQC